MKKIYEKPILIKQTMGMINKFQSGFNDQGMTEIDGVKIKDIVEKFGSPVFVFSERELRKTIRSYVQAFKAYYPNVVFAWSYKTNYLGAICSILHSEGCLAEVVSEFEYQKAKRLGVPGHKIIFNGPCKRSEILEVAAADGAMINIDHFDEIFRLEEIAAKRNKKIDVGLRINLDSGVYPQWSRFGFNLENGQALTMVKRLVKNKKLNLVGVHCHMGTFMLSTKAYQISAEKLLQFAATLKEEYKITLEYINLGGGFPSRNRLKGIYLPPDFSVPPVQDFAKMIGQTLHEKTNPHYMPTVYFESGRAVVDDSGYLITSIVGSKRLVDGKKAYILDAGVNLMVTPQWYDIPVKVGVDFKGPVEDSILYGPLCMNIDVIRDFVRLPPLSAGTPLIFHPVGAYCVTFWMQFIEYRPNIILITENNEIEVIRRKETLDDVIGNEQVPERLKKFKL